MQVVIGGEGEPLFPPSFAAGSPATVGIVVLDPFCGSGGFAMENLVKLIEAVSALIVALSILLAVIGAFYRR